MSNENSDWRAFTGVWLRDHDEPSDAYEQKVFGHTPHWRRHVVELDEDAGSKYLSGSNWDETFKRGKNFVFDLGNADDIRIVELINAALYLQRPLLVKGDTGVGKSSLAYAIAAELGLGSVLYWPITSHSTIKDGLYRYDIIRHLQGTKPTERPQNDVGVYFALKQLGIAFENRSKKPRVVLIDELDKADMDLPNNLLHVLEEGKFQIDELSYSLDSNRENSRLPEVRSEGRKFEIEENGWVTCGQFPIIVMTSNKEREFPEPFLRRCITIELKKPNKEKLFEIVNRHFDDEISGKVGINGLIQKFINEGNKKHIATDRLLNAIHIYKEFYKLEGHEAFSNGSLIEDILGIINQSK